jgi:hypothetical protein
MVMYRGLTDARNTAEIPALTARYRWKNARRRIHVYTKAGDLKEAKTRRIPLKANPDIISINTWKNIVLVRSNK